MTPAPTPIDLEQTEWGAGDRRLLIVHGLGSNAAGWWRAGPALADAGFHVVGVDLRGHGESDSPGDYRVQAYAADLLALGQDWDVVLGHSLGGAAAVQAMTERPAWTERLILEDPMLILLDQESAAEYVTADLGPDVTVEDVAAANPTWHFEDSRIKHEAQAQAGREVLENSIAHNPGWNVVGSRCCSPGSDAAAGGRPRSRASGSTRPWSEPGRDESEHRVPHGQQRLPFHASRRVRSVHAPGPRIRRAGLTYRPLELIEPSPYGARMPDDDMPVEEEHFDSIPWSSLIPQTRDRPWLVYVAAGAVVALVLGVLASRSVGTSAPAASPVTDITSSPATGGAVPPTPSHCLRPIYAPISNRAQKVPRQPP